MQREPGSATGGEHRVQKEPGKPGEADKTQRKAEPREKDAKSTAKGDRQPGKGRAQTEPRDKAPKGTAEKDTEPRDKGRAEKSSEPRDKPGAGTAEKGSEPKDTSNVKSLRQRIERIPPPYGAPAR
jgi:hypothetical protein